MVSEGFQGHDQVLSENRGVGCSGVIKGESMHERTCRNLVRITGGTRFFTSIFSLEHFLGKNPAAFVRLSIKNPR